MKVLHVSPSFFPAYTYGGPVESGYHLCRELGRIGCDVRVLTTDANGPSQVLETETSREIGIAERLRVRYCHRLAFQSGSPTLLRLLPSYVRWANVVHLTAVYSFPTIPTLLACRLAGKPLIWSPRGSLQRWGDLRRAKLKHVWKWLCRTCAPRNLALHVTSPEEERQSLQSFPSTTVVLIPNGVFVPDSVGHADATGLLRLLFLGRLHPIKGLERLLSACRILSDRSPLLWSLTIAGGGAPDYVKSVRAKVAELRLARQVSVIGHVVGEAKERLFHEADVVVVPSFSENFGMVVAEALARGVPVIASRGTPWKGLEDTGCGLWVDNEPESLAKAVTDINGMPLREMGRRGREWMQRDFSWDAKANEMLMAYKSIATVAS